MKYPQLVSTKAVNEISDWLIKRLEDLDIEDPGVYSRLLLSLLHTPLKINAIDLLEDLKQPYRLLNKNNEELKRLAAVESLMEVSAEENKSSIINLVDELHSKLRKIESNTEENPMLSRTPNSASSSPISATASNVSKLHKNLKKIKRIHGAENPTKNYYLAFPALNSNKKSSTSKAASVPSNEVKSLTKGIEKNINSLSWSNLMSTKSETVAAEGGKGLRIKTPQQQQQQQQRRKQKRFEKGCGSRRLSKATNSIDVQFETKSFNLYDNATFSPKKMPMVKSNAVSSNSNKKAKHQRNNYDSAKRVVSNQAAATKTCDVRNTNFSNIAQQNAPKMDGTALGPWDMDFKGQWEMDRDLISEFIQQQNKGKMKKGANSSTWQLPQPPASQQINWQSYLHDDDDDVMLMNCLPTKFIESSLDESADPLDLNRVQKPCNNKEALSISSLKSKFDENVKAIWSDDCGGGGGSDPMKPLTGVGICGSGDMSLASSFANETNSLSLFNFNEPAPPPTHAKSLIEVVAPAAAMCIEMTSSSSSYGGGSKNYDFNNNVASFFSGGRGAISMSNNSHYFGAYNQQQPLSFVDHHSLSKSDFIKSGTNLTTSIWSDDGFTGETECLILKDEVVESNVDEGGCDEIDSTYKRLSSIGTELKQWQNSSNVDDEDEEISLINHSSEKSAFKKFRPLIASTIIRASYHPLNMNQSDRKIMVDSACSNTTSSSREAEENLLTSEKTHFSPIIRDGHTFVIDNNWDSIEYERSPSGGGLYYKNKRYQLWKGHKPQMNNDDIDLSALEDDSSENFSIKYMLCDNDKGCQTEENDFMRMSRNFLEINEDYCRRKIYDEYFKGVTENNKWRCLNNGSEDSNDYSFFSVNRVKNNHNLTPKTTFPDILHSSNSSSSSICTITSAAGIDPFESWRNLNADQDHKHNCGHRLWEQCITCTRADEESSFIEKPLPANRLMKDELQLDGDEIMNVIQNLYITSDYCEDEEEKDDECDGFDVNHVMDIISMDDSMDGIEDESKFYESAVDLKVSSKNQKNMLEKGENLITFDDFDEIALAKMQYAMENDQEKCIKFLKWIQSLARNNNNNNNNAATSTTTTIKADKNNNDCSVSEVHRPTKNRKRRHSTCQNLFMEKKCFHSQEQGFTYHLNLDTGSTPTAGFDFNPANNNDLFFDASKMLKINIEKILLITNDDRCMEGGEQELQQHQGGMNYYRNIMQQQHALIKHLDLSRPLTR